MRALILVLLVAACSDSALGGKTDGGASERFGSSVQAGAERLVRAVSEGDADVQVELAHPKLVAMAGGEEKYRAALARAKADFKAKGVSLHAKLVGAPRVVSRAGKLYALVDYDLEVVSPTESAVMAAFFVGESDANGMRWRFIDGAGTKGDVARLRDVLPDWPEELKLRVVARR